MAQLKTYLMHMEEQQMTEAELEDYLDHLYQEWLMQHEAYRYEDNYKPFNTPQPHRNTTNKGAK